ncbi:uncharacterized protein LOC134823117 [Bolinopsis microptera]|uniref:uncharacterized protein LOC134823117 n=1 Tax=Bolinopsis microptera TaxID=2820187 RepID=UPI00307912D3
MAKHKGMADQQHGNNAPAAAAAAAARMPQRLNPMFIRAPPQFKSGMDLDLYLQRTVERDFPLMVKLSIVLYSTKAPSMLMFLTRVRRAAGGGGVFGAAGGGVAGAAGGGVTGAAGGGVAGAAGGGVAGAAGGVAGAAGGGVAGAAGGGVAGAAGAAGGGVAGAAGGGVAGAAGGGVAGAAGGGVAGAAGAAGGGGEAGLDAVEEVDGAEDSLGAGGGMPGRLSRGRREREVVGLEGRDVEDA